MIGTPGEPEESCVFAQPTVVVPLPLTSGTPGAPSALVLVGDGPSLAVYTLPLDADVVPRELTLPHRLLPLGGGEGVDVDGDGASDLVLIDDEWSPTRAIVWLGPLAEDPSDALVLEASAGAFAAIAAGDVDGDGRDDLVALQQTTLWMGLR